MINKKSLSLRPVSGKVAWPDGSAPQDIGSYSVRAFEAPVTSAEPQPLGKPVALAADGRNFIPYRWTSTASRNGPTLLVQVVDSNEQVVGEARRSTTELQATLNISLEAPPAPAPMATTRAASAPSSSAPPQPKCRAPP